MSPAQAGLCRGTYPLLRAALLVAFVATVVDVYYHQILPAGWAVLVLAALGGAVWLTRRRLGVLGLALLFFAALAYPFSGSAGAVLPFSASVVLVSMVLAIVIELRRGAAIIVGVYTLVVAGAAAFGSSTELGRNSLDLIVLTAALLLAGAFLMERLSATVAELEAAAAASAASQHRSDGVELLSAAEDTVRRVLHDDVITALRAVADASPGQEEHVRRACGRAVSSISRLAS